VREEPDKAGAEERNKKNTTTDQLRPKSGLHITKSDEEAVREREESTREARSPTRLAPPRTRTNAQRTDDRELIITYSHFARRPPEKATRNELASGDKKMRRGRAKAAAAALRLSLSACLSLSLCRLQGKWLLDSTQ